MISAVQGMPSICRSSPKPGAIGIGIEPERSGRVWLNTAPSRQVHVHASSTGGGGAQLREGVYPRRMRQRLRTYICTHMGDLPLWHVSRASASIPDGDCARVLRQSKRDVRKMKACIVLIAIYKGLTTRVQCGVYIGGSALWDFYLSSLTISRIPSVPPSPVVHLEAETWLLNWNQSQKSGCLAYR